MTRDFWKIFGPVVLSGFFLGGASALGQILVIRESLTVFSGNEITLSIILATWFLGVCLGSLLAGRIKGLSGSSLVSLCLLLIGPATAGALLLARWSRHILEIGRGQIPTFGQTLAGTALITIPLSIVIGFSLPALAALARQESPVPGRATAMAYTSEGFGAALAGFAYTFLLAGRVGDGAIALFLWGFGVILWVLVLAGRRGLVRVAGLLLGLSLMFQAPLFDRATVDLRWSTICPDLPLIESLDSRYQNIALTSQSELFSIFCDGQYAFSFPDPYVASEEAFMALVQHPKPEKILIFGDGSAALAPYLLSVEALSPQVMTVPFDPEISDLVRRRAPTGYYPSKNAARYRETASDGRLFLGQCDETFDLIILNLPESSSILTNRYHTLEFFRSLKAILAPGGTIATSVSSSENYLSGDAAAYLAGEVATLKGVFSKVMVVPGQRARIYASDSSETLLSSPEAMKERYEGFRIASDTFDPEMYYVLAEEDKIQQAGERLSGHLMEAEINSDDRPRAFLHHLKFWEKMTSGSRGTMSSAVLGALEKAWPWAMGLTGTLLFLMALGNLLRSPSAFSGEASKWPWAELHLSLGVMTTGFTAMATQTAILALYQSVFGFLYSAIGAINGIFMTGLILGGWLCARRGLGGSERLFLFSEALAVIAPMGGWMIAGPMAGLVIGGSALSFFRGQVIFALVSFLAGWATGMSLPSAAALFQQCKTHGPEEKTAARLNFNDHFGALAGAALMGLCVIPALGFEKSLLLVLLLKGASFTANTTAFLNFFRSHNHEHRGLWSS